MQCLYDKVIKFYDWLLHLVGCFIWIYSGLWQMYYYTNCTIYCKMWDPRMHYKCWYIGSVLQEAWWWLSTVETCCLKCICIIKLLYLTEIYTLYQMKPDFWSGFIFVTDLAKQWASTEKKRFLPFRLFPKKVYERGGQLTPIIPKKC